MKKVQQLMHGVRLYCVTLFFCPDDKLTSIKQTLPHLHYRVCSLATLGRKHTSLQHCVTCDKCRIIKFCKCYVVLKNCVLQSCSASVVMQNLSFVNFASVRFHQILKLLYFMSAVFQVLHCFQCCSVAIKKVLSLSLTCCC